MGFPFPTPQSPLTHYQGGLAQLGERLLCKQDVVGSIPSSSTSPCAPCGEQNWEVALGKCDKEFRTLSVVKQSGWQKGFTPHA